jgi:hypothetical protein
MNRQELRCLGCDLDNKCLVNPPIYCPTKKIVIKTGAVIQLQPKNKRRSPMAISTGICIAIIHCNVNFLVFDRQYPKIILIKNMDIIIKNNVILNIPLYEGTW